MMLVTRVRAQPGSGNFLSSATAECHQPPDLLACCSHYQYQRPERVADGLRVWRVLTLWLLGLCV